MNNLLPYLNEQVRDFDPDRFLCVLFTRREKRDALVTLLAFNSEISKIPELVREPALGHIRLQWWRDCMAMIYSGSFDQKLDNTLVSNLHNIINRFNLSRQLFEKLIDARFKHISAKTHQNEAALRTYAHETSATLCILMLEILCPNKLYVSQDEIYGAIHIGIAWAFTGLLRSSTFLALNNRTHIPETLITRFKINKNDIFARKATPEILLATSFQVGIARSEIQFGLNRLHDKTKIRYLPIFLQAHLAGLFLDRIERYDFNPFSGKIESGRMSRQIKLAFTAAHALF